MKILILGSTGLVGYAIKRECEIRNIEILCPSHKDLDITHKKDIEAYIKIHKPEIIINSVAIAGKAQCLVDKRKAYNINTQAVKYLTDICTMNDILLVHMSSSSIFDGRSGDLYIEYSKPNPTTYYGRTKYLAELYIKNNCVKYYIFRLPLIFGDRNNLSVGVLDRFIKDILNKKDLYIATDKIQSCGYSCDIAKEIIDIMMNDETYGVYHLRNKGDVSLYKFIRTVNKYLGCPININKGKCKDFGDVKSNICLRSIRRRDNLRHWKKAMYEYINEKHNKRK